MEEPQLLAVSGAVAVFGLVDDSTILLGLLHVHPTSIGESGLI